MNSKISPEKFYTPEHPFQNQGNIIYNLKDNRLNIGQQYLVNDVVIKVEANHLPPKIQDKIIEVIKNALNNQFLP